LKEKKLSPHGLLEELLARARESVHSRLHAFERTIRSARVVYIRAL